MSSVKVAVRVRPFNSREMERNAELIVQMQDKMTILRKPKSIASSSSQADKGGSSSDPDEKKFSYDFSYWSFNREDPTYASQRIVFDDLGRDVLNNAWEGFNCSIFAYGQTGSGKSYSMLGYGEDKGIIPLVCEEMFSRINGLEGGNVMFKVEVSFMEIYNEKVKDLLNPKNNKLPGGLKVRNHPTTGPYVEDLSKLAVKSFQEIETLMDEGTKARTVASTNMNATSSRSHGVFTIVFTQTIMDRAAGSATERVSKISLVDLAGSERATSTGATGVRLKEGANINKSLSTLGKVISALAENSGNPKKMAFVPYRDSVLTWLLKESLGGNAKTIMIAAISPADINYDETLSTLRYADSAKKIKNAAVVNEDPKAKLIRDLQEEVEKLRSQLGGAPSSSSSSSSSSADAYEVTELRDKLEQTEKIMAELNKSWEEKLSEAKLVREERMAALKDMGVAIKVVSSVPHLINLNEDQMMNEALIYYLPAGITRVGRPDADEPQDIVLNGLSIQKEHCRFEHSSHDGTVTILPPEELIEGHSFIYVNGAEITEPKVLTQGARVVLGYNHMFRFNHPEEAARLARERGADIKATSSASSSGVIDYNFALRELAAAQGKLLINRRGDDDYPSSTDGPSSGVVADEPLRLSEDKEKFIKDMARRWRERVERSRLERQISSLILLINEANAISHTLGRSVRFEMHLLATFPEIAQDLAVDQDSAFLSWHKTQVGVRASHGVSGASCVLSTSEFADRLARMRELYQNYFEGNEDVPRTPRGEKADNEDGGANVDDDDDDADDADFDPFAINSEENRMECIGKSVLYPKGILYGFNISRELAVIDDSGQTVSRLRVALSYKTPTSPSPSTEDNADRPTSPSSSNINTNEDSNSSSSERPEMKRSFSSLSFHADKSEMEVALEVGKPIEMGLALRGISGVKFSEYVAIMFKVTFQGQTYESAHYDNAEFLFEKILVNDVITPDLISALETGIVLIEVWGLQQQQPTQHAPLQQQSSSSSLQSSPRHNNNNSSNNSNGNNIKAPDSASKKQPETFELIANLNILEAEGQHQGASNPNYNTVPTEEEPEQENLPSVLFRLRRDRPHRVLELTIAKSDPPLFILGCKSVSITGMRLVGKHGGGRNGVMGIGGSGTSSSSSSSSSSSGGGGSGGSPLTPASKERIELAVQDTTDDTVRCSWVGRGGIFSQRTRKGERVVLSVVWKLDFRNFGHHVEISKEISVKVYAPDDSADSFMLFKPVTATPSPSQSGDNVALQLPVVPPPVFSFSATPSSSSSPSHSNNNNSHTHHHHPQHSIPTSSSNTTPNNVGSLFSVVLTKTREVEHKSRIGEMIDTHQEALLKLGNTLQIERVRQELDLRKLLTTPQPSSVSSSEASTERYENGDDQSSPYKPRRERDTSSSSSESGQSLLPNTDSPSRDLPELGNGRLGIDAMGDIGEEDDPRTNELMQQMQSLMTERSHLEKAFPGNPTNKRVRRERATSFVQVRVNEVDSSELREHEASGWLRKKSNFRADTWKDRWFVLRKPQLYYSTDKTASKKDRRQINLATTTISIVEEAQWTFSIVAWNRVWLLQAKTESDFQMWVGALDPSRHITDMKDAQIKQARMETEAQVATVQELKDKVESLLRDSLSKDATISQMSNSVHDLTQQVNTTRSQLDVVTNDLHTKKDELTQLQLALQESRAQVSSQDNANKAVLESKIVDLEKTIAALETKSKSLEHENSEVKDLLSQIESTVPPLKTSLSSLTDQLSVLSQEKVEAEARDQHHIEAVRALTHECEKMRAECEQAEIYIKKEKETRAEADRLHAEAIAKLTSEKDTSIEESSRLKSQLSEQDREVGRLRGELASSSHEVSDLQGQISSLTSAMDASAQLVGSSNSQADITRKHHEAEKERLNKIIEDLRAENTKLSQEVQVANQQKVELQGSVSRLSNDVQDKERDFEQFEAQYSQENQTRISALERSLHSKASQIETLTRTVMQSSRALEAANANYSAALSSPLSSSSTPTSPSPSIAVTRAPDTNPDKPIAVVEPSNEPSVVAGGTPSRLNSGSGRHSRQNSGTDMASIEAVLTKMDASLQSARDTIEKQHMTIEHLKEQISSLESQSKLVQTNHSHQLEALQAQIDQQAKTTFDAQQEAIEKGYQLQLLRDSSKLLEEDLALKESRLGLLQKSVDETREQYAGLLANGLKDPFGLQPSTGFFSSRKNLEDQMNAFRESTIAHQTHNAFLGAQLERVDRDRLQQEVVYQGVIARLKKDLVARTQQMRDAVRDTPISGSATGVTSDWASSRIAELEGRLETINKKFFISLVVGSKLQNYIAGQSCNVDGYELYDKALV